MSDQNKNEQILWAILESSDAWKKIVKNAIYMEHDMDRVIFQIRGQRPREIKIKVTSI